MKKTIFIFLAVVLAITLLALIYLKRPVVLGDSRAAEFLPGDTVALFQVTDLQRSRARWKETALYKIAHEPEVIAFLEKPKSKIPQNSATQDKLDKVRNLEVKEAFVGITAITDKIPKFVAGFDYKGKKADAEALIADLKKELKSQFPAGKSDIVKYADVEIETFQTDDVLIATCFKHHWFFASDDLDTLKATMDRLDGKGDAKASLRENAEFKAAVAKLPDGADAICFVQPKTIADRFGALLAISNPSFDAKQLDELKKIRAVSAGMKFDGEKIRDAVYILKPGGIKQSSLARNSLAFTSPETLFFFATALNLSGAPKLPNPALDATGILTALSAIQGVMEQQGLTYADFAASFGPELGAVVDWPSGAMQPSLLLSLDVRDGAKAQKFTDVLASGQAGFAAWAKQDIDGAHYYSMPQTSLGIVPIAPVLALNDKALVFGLGLEPVQKAVQDARGGANRLDKKGDFKTAAGTVSNPTGAFGYIDSKALFEKVYGVASNTLKMMAMFNPHANDYADLSKLPSTEAISKHLSPIVYSQSTDENGTLMESSGPVTFNQTIFGLGAGAGVASFGYYNKQQTQAIPPPSMATPPAVQPPAQPVLVPSTP